MEDIRDGIREAAMIKKGNERVSLLNKNRNIDVDNLKKITAEELVKMANDLKKKRIKPEEMSKLKEAFLQDKNNGNVFLEVDGALEALVRALSGQNAKFQLHAAYCLCNLSLGEKYLTITKIAGPYLVLHLEGMNTYLIEACLWTLGNLSSHSEKCVKMLKKQGALPLVSHLLNHSDENVGIAAAYALSHIVYTGYKHLTQSDLEDVTEEVITKFCKDPASVAYTMSVLSSRPECQFKLIQRGCHVTSVSCLSRVVRENILQSAWYIRVIANLSPESSGQVCLQVLSHTDSSERQTLSSAIDQIVRSRQVFLIKECCWLLGNMLNHPSEAVSRAVAESGILDIVSGSVGYLLMQE